MKHFPLTMSLGDDCQLPDHVRQRGGRNGVIAFILPELDIDARQFRVTLLQRQRGHLAEGVEICPKRDDVAMLAIISLGYDSPQTLTTG